MKFLKHMRSKSRLKNGDEALIYEYNAPTIFSPRNRSGRDCTSRLPLKLLNEILSNICSHACDDNYLSLEDSMRDGGCMLCDMRDLAQCALVSRRFLVATQTILSVGLNDSNRT